MLVLTFSILMNEIIFFLDSDNHLPFILLRISALGF